MLKKVDISEWAGNGKDHARHNTRETFWTSKRTWPHDSLQLEMALDSVDSTLESFPGKMFSN